MKKLPNPFPKQLYASFANPEVIFGRNVILSLLDNEAEKQSKMITVINLRRENLHLGKRNILSDKELSVSLCRR